MRELFGRFRRILAVFGGALLAALHIGVLWRRLADGSLLTPLVAVQWAVAGAILVAMVALRRRGVSLFHGRSGAAFWIVVALMHCIVALPGGPGFVGVLDTAPVTAAVPMSVALVAGVLLLLGALGGVTPRPRTYHRSRRTLAESALPDFLSGSIAPRAPPA